MTNYLSQSQIKRLVHQRENKPKQPKYGNHKVIVDGEKVADSKHEYRRLNELKNLERVGAIKDLQTQVRYKLIPSQKICGRTERGVSYVADFVYWTKDDQFICEVAQAALAAMNKVFVDWDVLNEKPPEFLKHRQDLVYYVERAGGVV